VSLIAFYAKNVLTDLDARQRKTAKALTDAPARNTGARPMSKIATRY